MKKALLMLTMVTLGFVNLSAQFETVNLPLALGVEIGYKAGINASEVPQGIKNGLNFANLPDFGLQTYVPFQGQSKMGLLANLGYYTFPYKLSYEGNSEDTKYNFSYIGFGADFYMSGFTIGLNYGFPSAATIGDFDLNTDLLANMFEFRIGGHITLIETPTGRFNLNIRAGYFISGQYNDDRQILGKNSNPASLMVGLSYLFNLQETEE